MERGAEPRLREGDLIELRPGAPVPRYPWLSPGVQGRVVVAEAATEREPSGEITVLFAFHRNRPIRLHRRWVRFISRAKGRGRSGALVDHTIGQPGAVVAPVAAVDLEAE